LKKLAAFTSIQKLSIERRWLLKKYSGTSFKFLDLGHNGHFINTRSLLPKIGISSAVGKPTTEGKAYCMQT
jgi:hypothetical protein